MKNNLVTIVTVTYNAEKYLEDRREFYEKQDDGIRVRLITMAELQHAQISCDCCRALYNVNKHRKGHSRLAYSG